MKNTRTLTAHLRPLTALDANALARIAGGQTASTSTSGTPEAGDDTIGDSGGGRGPLRDMHIESFSWGETQ
jgi:hypothetical protein